MYALCLQGELKQKTLTLQNIAQAGQMNMCPSRQWGASIPPIFSMGGFSSGPLVDLLQLDLPKHPNHVWKAHRLGMIRLSAAVKLWSCRHALGLQSTSAPPAAGRRLPSGAPRRVSANVHVPPPAGRGSKYMHMRSNSTAWSHHTTQSMLEGSLCDRRTIEFMRHPAMSTTQNSYHYDLLFWDLPIGYSSLLVPQRVKFESWKLGFIVFSSVSRTELT